jgi:hypothetical protein
MEELPIRAAFRLLQRGSNVGKVVVRRSTTLCLTGAIATEDALDVLQQLPGGVPMLIEVRSIQMDADDDLVQFLLSWTASIVLVCKGEVCGHGALLLLDASLITIGDTSCTFVLHVDDANPSYRRFHVRGEGRYSAQTA